MIPHYELTAVRKSHGTKVALDVQKLTIWRGRLHILMGPNGSGKTTLLNLLAFLSCPDNGRTIFAGEPVLWNRPQLKMLRRRVTLLHQFPYLFAGTVFSNLAFGLKLRGMKGEALRAAVLDALARVGLAGFAERNVRALSGGEARRVALARALALKPSVLLLDEPLANVDEESANMIERLIASLLRQETTVVMSTHDLQQGDKMQASTIRLLDGRLKQSPNGEAQDEELRARF